MNKLIYIMALGAFGIITTEFGVIGILPDLVKEFHISIDTAGWLLSAFALTVALAGPFTNMLTARLNRKFVMCLVLGIFVISNLLSAIAPNFTVLMIARILPAFLHPVFWAVSMTAAAKQAGPKDAPKAISIVMGGLSVATVLGVPLTTYMADLFSWRASFLLSAVINLLAFGALTLFAPSMPVNEEQASPKSQVKLLRSVHLWIKLLASTIILAGMFATYGYLAEYLDKVSRMSGAQISMMLLVFGGTGIAGNWLMGIALSKNVTLTTRLFLLSLVATHVLAYLFGGHFIPMVIILSVWGFIHTGGFLAANIQLTHGIQEPALDFVNSLLPSFFNAGITLGTLLGGFVIAHYGIHQVIWMTVPLLLLAFGMSFITSNATKRSISAQIKEIPEDEPVQVAIYE
ncbi:MFS transporter [Mucilaginibacter sp. NFR10]|uniref:MFS transporter n=1 Tax=Mucilaginibacter sp. NFR10 TaxID=1566292 RepID=UPI0008711ABE|nr:MFS transporter [Mucilaginibacter sp. NFR10]SCW46422.1 Predicted arabinose efflux permease, MFS family [Mucilaginibacter sp. NFR10]